MPKYDTYMNYNLKEISHTLNGFKFIVFQFSLILKRNKDTAFTSFVGKVSKVVSNCRLQPSSNLSSNLM